MELLDVWERGLRQSAADRALILLEEACEREDPAQLALGERDARLLTLREWTFGPEISALTTCPDCGVAQELRFQTSEIRVFTPESPEPPLAVSVDKFQLEVRLPNSYDLRLLETCVAESDDPRMLILEHCLIRATRDGTPVAARDLPATVVDVIADRMAEADPQGDIQLALECFDCRRQWRAPIDIGSFFWDELQAWASRLLNEVHQLASAYGWSEAAILGMSPFRRNLYLNLIAE